MKIPAIFVLFLFLRIPLFGADTLSSPDGRMQLTFELREQKPFYRLSRAGELLVEGEMGFRLSGLPGLDGGFSRIAADTLSSDETWQPVWGETDHIRNHYRELFVRLGQSRTDGYRMDIRFRLYDDGLGFRYEFPVQPHLTHFCIDRELTAFRLDDDCDAFWIPGDYDSNEFTYQRSRLSALPDTLASARRFIESKTLIDDRSVQTPLLLRKQSGVYLNIHEAALVDFPAMALSLLPGEFSFRACLTPDPGGFRGRVQTGFQTPWRTIIVSADAAGIIESKLVLNLNEPCTFASTDWIRPMKYIGIWWELFVPGRSTWTYCDTTNIRIDRFDYDRAIPHGRHGATTGNVKHYLDFAASHGFDGVLVEGWNIGWEDWFDRRKDLVFDFQTPYPDFDLDALSAYAATRGVPLIMHHETSGSIMNYERRMDKAYTLMNRFGYPCVKSGYVGRLLPVGEYHYGQTFVNHCLYALREAASRKIMVNAHESPHPTGLHRTYPNFLACESARGTEYEAFSSVRPDHTTILPFTRLTGGPMDYTPGIFQLDFSYYDPSVSKKMSSTLAKQLGLYVVIYSPFQMAADLPENYLRFADAFRFIREVPVDWSETRVLEAEPGEYLTIARRGKNSPHWYIGSTANEKGHHSVIPLSFLDADARYEATIYSDAPDAGYNTNPMAYRIRTLQVDSRSELSVRSASGGGYAVSLRRVD